MTARQIFSKMLRLIGTILCFTGLGLSIGGIVIMIFNPVGTNVALLGFATIIAAILVFFADDIQDKI